MANQTVTRATESDFEPGEIFKVLAEVSNIPRWAPVFGDAIERFDDTHCRVTKNGAVFGIEVLLNRDAGTVDYIREMSNNRRGGAYIRVTPRPLGGSVVSMTVPIGPNTNEADVATVVDQELVDLIRLVRA
jgi:hypothetical protein